jgi:hypothetical protein
MTTSQPPWVSEKPQKGARVTDWVGGVILSLLLPLIGLIVGIVYATKDDSRRQVGIMCICLSLLVSAAWFGVSAAA